MQKHQRNPRPHLHVGYRRIEHIYSRHRTPSSLTHTSSHCRRRRFAPEGLDRPEPLGQLLPLDGVVIPTAGSAPRSRTTSTLRAPPTAATSTSGPPNFVKHTARITSFPISQIATIKLVPSTKVEVKRYPLRTSVYRNTLIPLQARAASLTGFLQSLVAHAEEFYGSGHVFGDPVLADVRLQKRGVSVACLDRINSSRASAETGSRHDCCRGCAQSAFGRRTCRG